MFNSTITVKQIKQQKVLYNVEHWILKISNFNSIHKNYASKYEKANVKYSKLLKWIASQWYLFLQRHKPSSRCNLKWKYNYLISNCSTNKAAVVAEQGVKHDISIVTSARQGTEAASSPLPNYPITRYYCSVAISSNDAITCPETNWGVEKYLRLYNLS